MITSTAPPLRIVSLGWIVSYGILMFIVNASIYVGFAAVNFPPLPTIGFAALVSSFAGMAEAETIYKELTGEIDDWDSGVSSLTCLTVAVFWTAFVFVGLPAYMLFLLSFLTMGWIATAYQARAQIRSSGIPGR